MRTDELNKQEPHPSGDLSMLEAMKLGVDQALRIHRDRGVSIIIWDRSAGQIVEMPVDQIPEWSEAANPPS